MRRSPLLAATEGDLFSSPKGAHYFNYAWHTAASLQVMQDPAQTHVVWELNSPGNIKDYSLYAIALLFTIY